MTTANELGENNETGDSSTLKEKGSMDPTAISESAESPLESDYQFEYAVPIKRKEEASDASTIRSEKSVDLHAITDSILAASTFSKRRNSPEKFNRYLNGVYDSSHPRMFFHLGSECPPRPLENQIVHLPWPSSAGRFEVPTLSHTLQFCYALAAWLDGPGHPLAIVMCENGKTRTAVAVACYLRFAGIVDRSLAGFCHFLEQRCRISRPELVHLPPSLKTLFDNFDALLTKGDYVNKNPVLLKAMTIQGVPVEDRPCLDVWDGTGKHLYSSHAHHWDDIKRKAIGDAASQWGDEEGFYQVNCMVQGDFFVLCRFGGQYAGDTKDRTKILFRYANSSGCVKASSPLELTVNRVDLPQRYAAFFDEDEFLLSLIFEAHWGDGKTGLMQRNSNVLPQVHLGLAAKEAGWHIITDRHAVQPEDNDVDKLMESSVGELDGCPRHISLLALQLANSDFTMAQTNLLEGRLRSWWNISDEREEAVVPPHQPSILDTLEELSRPQRLEQIRALLESGSSVLNSPAPNVTTSNLLSRSLPVLRQHPGDVANMLRSHRTATLVHDDMDDSPLFPVSTPKRRAEVAVIENLDHDLALNAILYDFDHPSVDLPDLVEVTQKACVDSTVGLDTGQTPKQDTTIAVSKEYSETEDSTIRKGEEVAVPENGAATVQASSGLPAGGIAAAAMAIRANAAPGPPAGGIAAAAAAAAAAKQNNSSSGQPAGGIAAAAAAAAMAKQSESSSGPPEGGIAAAAAAAASAMAKRTESSAGPPAGGIAAAAAAAAMAKRTESSSGPPGGGIAAAAAAAAMAKRAESSPGPPAGGIGAAAAAAAAAMAKRAESSSGPPAGGIGAAAAAAAMAKRAESSPGPPAGGIGAAAAAAAMAKRSGSSQGPPVGGIGAAAAAAAMAKRAESSPGPPAGGIGAAAAAAASAMAKRADSSSAAVSEPHQPVAEVNDGDLPLKNHPKYQKYFKMLKMGLPPGAVHNAMQRDNVDSFILDLDQEKSLNEQTNQGGDNDEPPLKEDPKYVKYFKMMKMGLPEGAVRNALLRDGVDDFFLSLDPDKSLKSQMNASPSDDGPPLKDDPKYQKYFKMLKMGLPDGAVRNAMERDGVDSSVLDLDPEKSVQSQMKSAGADSGVPLKDDPVFEKYFKMLKMGLPTGAVQNAMQRDGADHTLLDLDPEKSLQSQRNDAEEIDETEDDGVPIKEDPAFEKYFKMLKMGLPQGAVRNAMERDGVDSSVLDLDPDASLASQQNKEEEGVPLKDDPEWSKYFKMMKMGLPLGAIKNAVERDGKDPAILDLDHTKSIASQTKSSLSKRSTAKKKKKKVRRKKIYWNPLDSQQIAEDSIWSKMKGTVEMSKLNYDAKEFADLFTESTDPSDRKTPQKKKSTASAKKSVQVIDGKRSMNGGIILARLKMDYKKIALMVDQMNSGSFDSNTIKSLKELLATDDERRGLEGYMKRFGPSDEEQAKGYKDLSECEKYMYTMNTVDDASSKFDCMLFRSHFQVRLDDLLGSIRQVEQACDEVRSSEKLRIIMAMILTLVNEINTGGDGNAAAGFTLDALLKLNEAKAFDKKTSVLHYLVKLLKRNDETLLAVKDDLPHSKDAELVILDSLCGDIQTLNEEIKPVLETTEAQAEKLESAGALSQMTLKELSEQRTSVKNISDVPQYNKVQHLTGRTPMERFTISAGAKLNEAVLFTETVKDKFIKLLDYFGEDKGMASNEFFGIMNRFFVDFEAAVQHVKKEELAKKREEAKRIKEEAKEEAKKRKSGTASGSSPAKDPDTKNGVKRQGSGIAALAAAVAAKKKQGGGTVPDDAGSSEGNKYAAPPPGGIATMAAAAAAKKKANEGRPSGGIAAMAAAAAAKKRTNEAPSGGIAAMAAAAASKKKTNSVPSSGGIAAMAAAAAAKKNTNESRSGGIAAMAAAAASKKRTNAAPPSGGIAAMAAAAAAKRNTSTAPPSGGIAAMAAAAAKKKINQGPPPSGGIAAMAAAAASKKETSGPPPSGGIAAMAAAAASKKKISQSPPPSGGIAAMAAAAAAKKNASKTSSGGIAAMAASAASKRSTNEPSPSGGIAAMAAAAAAKRNTKDGPPPSGGIAAVAAAAASKKKTNEDSLPSGGIAAMAAAAASAATASRKNAHETLPSGGIAAMAAAAASKKKTNQVPPAGGIGAMAAAAATKETNQGPPPGGIAAMAAAAASAKNMKEGTDPGGFAPMVAFAAKKSTAGTKPTEKENTDVASESRAELSLGTTSAPVTASKDKDGPFLRGSDPQQSPENREAYSITKRTLRKTSDDVNKRWIAAVKASISTIAESERGLEATDSLVGARPLGD